MDLLKVREQISCLDLKRQHQQIKGEVFTAFEKVYDDAAFSGGKYVQEFEHQFARFCKTKYALGVNNGTSALQLAILSLGVGPGDEVILPANTFIATAWGISYCGATPVFVDCTFDTWQIDVEAIEKRINSRTKAIIGVHLYGQPFDVGRVQQLCIKYNLPFIEDAAQAQGAKYMDEPVGGFGELACFSFYPGKNLGACGEAGGITTNNETIYKQILSLRNHGSTVRYFHDEIGYNMRMSGLESASLQVKLHYLPAWNERRQKIAGRYLSEITNSKITFQAQPSWAESVYHLFVILVENREALFSYLAQHQISPGLHYPVPCHLQKAYSYLEYQKGECPNAEYLSAHCASLPMYAELTDEEVSYVISVVNRF